MLTGWTIFDWLLWPIALVRNVMGVLIGGFTDPHSDLKSVPEWVIAVVAFSVLVVVSFKI